ncbi:MAG TPA: peptidase A24 [Archaeoglobus profundus]|nr:peptidase A24 [Archaeoglobus profundus]
MIIDVMKILVTLAILIKASIYDWKFREIPDNLWIMVIAFAIPLNIIQYILSPYNFLFLLIQFIIILGIAIIMLFLGFGGADIKALIALSIMFPIYPKVWIFPILNEGFGFFALSVLSNSLLVAPAIALGLFFRNLLRREEGKIIYYFIGYKVDVNNIPKFHNLLEYINENGKIVRVIKAVEPDDEMLKRLKDAKSKGLIDKVWVTPALPFLIFMTAGFVIAIILGDLIVEIIKHIISND